MRKWGLFIKLGALCTGCVSSVQEPTAMGPTADCAYEAEAVLGSPKWKPRKGDICADDTTTIIRFPHAQPLQRGPELFVLDGNKDKVVTYSQHGRHYRLSRPIDRSQLRLGKGDMAEVVRVDRASQ